MSSIEIFTFYKNDPETSATFTNTTGSTNDFHLFDHFIVSVFI